MQDQPTHYGSYWPYVLAVFPHPVLRAVMAPVVPGFKPTRAPGGWSDWLQSPGGLLVGAGIVAAIAVYAQKRG